MTDAADVFATATEAKQLNDRLFGKEEKEFGRVYRGRYHMPLLPGESGTKSGGDWVPYGVQRVTNLVGAFEDTRALSVWEQSMTLAGLALSPELYEELTLLVHRAASSGANFELMRELTELKEALAGDAHDSGKQEASIAGRAKLIARGSAGAQRGTNRHTAWEHRAETGELIGTPDIRAQIVETERLLAEAGLRRLPYLSERIVRNTEVGAAGKFDDILFEVSTERLLIADLKSKPTAFYSWMTVDAQLATYANADWMLHATKSGMSGGPAYYTHGPRQLGVDLTEGVILHVPSDGGPARLERADLVQGWETAKLARQVIDHRSAGKSAGRHARSAWITR